MTEPPKGPKRAFVVSKTLPTGGAPDKSAKPKEPEKTPAATASEAAAPPAEPAKPSGGVAKRVTTIQIGSKPKPK